jgi:hypothetical protein
MKKAADYRKHALECRALARGTHKEDERKQLLKMADAWMLLADEHESSRTTYPELTRRAEKEAADKEAAERMAAEMAAARS